MQFKLFCKHFLSVLRQFTPIYLIVVGLQIFVESIGSPTLRVLLLLVYFWLGVGAWIVFVKLKRLPHQSEDFFRLKASAKDLYWIASWPWFVLHKLRRENNDFR